MAWTSSTISNATTISDFAGGVSGVAGQGDMWTIAFGGTWAVGDTFSCEMVTPSQTYDFGTGRVTSVVPTSAITLNKRVHFVAGNYWYGSDNNDATAWDQQAPGAFKIKVSNQFSQNENLLSLSPFQGRMAVFSRNTITLWNLDSDPTNISLTQTLANIGTVGPFATQNLGDLDVLFPNDTGLRSLRVMTINLNGFISDIGAPIDSLIQADIVGQSNDALKGVVAIVDPVGKRYFVYMPSEAKIYVLSYFPTAKIVAWCSFLPTIGTISFQITEFKVFGQVVYFRGITTNGTLPNGTTSFVGCYGTPDGSSQFMYDSVNPVVVFPWLDLKNPGTRKTSKGVDVVIQGQWSLYGSMDFNGVNVATDSLKTIYPQLNAGSSSIFASAQTGLITWVDEGYHMQFKAIADNSAYPGVVAKFSELVFYYQIEGEKP